MAGTMVSSEPMEVAVQHGRTVLGALTLIALLLAAACSPAPWRAPIEPLPDATGEPAAVVTSEQPGIGGVTRQRTPSPEPDGSVTEIGPAPADNSLRSWYYTPNAKHQVPAVPAAASALLDRYRGRYVGPDPRRVYLTFDAGYENGQTSHILDALARNHVKATFFVTESYVRANPDLVRRMVREGHAVGNHSATHPSMPSLANDPAAFAREMTRVEDAFAEVTGGARLARVFRPPKGEYSALSLYRTAALGYESVFWSFAHRDWVVDDQPPVDVTVRRILDGSHPGAIYLLHAVSSSDADALDEAIAGLRDQGYGFGMLGK
ncbi:polysaccharide deacetylase family protein [Coriobacteriia bacterium Es71-Z0120]|uniref:polysaccharide deacetylase family protein n=1 Tax=Parvivirga hydrogeniphila TaxID=2939460 RepID=UPI00226094F3|nr:polysaccharide deacetylase family protein [Parvivirga hydrogeniphila]MCL4078310.1 polysaccharide deacetylase family protein [Parvivirga hydrogeniphila]